MVHISDGAAELIRSLVADSDLPDSAGLRLGTDDDKQFLEMNLAVLPREHDLVLEHAGATLFVSPMAAPRVEDQTLQAQLEPRPAFFLD